MKHLDGAICLFTIVAILSLVLVIAVSVGDLQRRDISLNQEISDRIALYESESVASR